MSVSGAGRTASRSRDRLPGEPWGLIPLGCLRQSPFPEEPQSRRGWGGVPGWCRGCGPCPEVFHICPARQQVQVLAHPRVTGVSLPAKQGLPRSPADCSLASKDLGHTSLCKLRLFVGSEVL